jgi:hypothetical protein
MNRLPGAAQETKMATLQDTVRSVVEDFITRDELFTALDVSNKVKSQQPNARHGEVRDVVRNMFTTEIETRGYTRSPINVTLKDGTTRDALLYHPLSDTWDLDIKYDTQKRQQISLNPTAVAAATVAAAAASTWVATPVALPAPAVPTATVTVSAAVPMPTARNLWDNLFATQPSLFPTK